MADFLSELLCTNCHAAGLDLQDESGAVCRFCGTVNHLEGVICPRCEAINAAGAQACVECHQSLTRACAHCGTPNWAGAERCLRCREPLDAVASMSSRYGADTAARLRAQAREANSLKSKEAADSARRLAELNAIEARRQQAIDQAARARDNEQRFWIAALIVLGFLVVTGTIVALVLFASH